MPRSAPPRPAIRACTSASRSPVPKNFKEAEVRAAAGAQGYTRIHERSGDTLEVVQDRLRLGSAERARVMESLETALRVGRGRVNLHVVR